jgi:hypothetical protein
MYFKINLSLISISLWVVFASCQNGPGQVNGNVQFAQATQFRDPYVSSGPGFVDIYGNYGGYPYYNPGYLYSGGPPAYQGNYQNTDQSGAKVININLSQAQSVQIPAPVMPNPAPVIPIPAPYIPIPAQVIQIPPPYVPVPAPVGLKRPLSCLSKDSSNTMTASVQNNVVMSDSTLTTSDVRDSNICKSTLTTTDVKDDSTLVRSTLTSSHITRSVLIDSTLTSCTVIDSQLTGMTYTGKTIIKNVFM